MNQELVLYSYSSPFANKYELDCRLFRIGDKDLYVKQNWKNDGKGGTEIGFGAYVYDCSFVLSKYIENNKEFIYNKLVIELGCGPGLASLAATILGARYTVATDGDDISIALASENIQRNAIGYNIISKRLLWGDNNDIESVLIDNNGFDVILAADIAALPYADHYKDLVYTLERLLNKSGIVLLCYQRRHISEDDFFSLLQEKFTVNILSNDCIHEDFKNKSIFIYECKLLDS